MRENVRSAKYGFLAPSPWDAGLLAHRLMQKLGALIGDAKVDHRGLDVPVPEPELHIARRPADFPEMHSDRVPQRMHVRAIRGQACSARVLVEQPVDLRARDRAR